MFGHLDKASETADSQAMKERGLRRRLPRKHRSVLPVRPAKY